ncbi:flagellar basal body-associated FliL family protein [Paenibacillus yanchengensis]|uniref:Flagellar protein FliL n=1 Tax=Paenibacillus yanchengensis TaxID=2035833 RepID=A0ABW4YMP7_9BACL
MKKMLPWIITTLLSIALIAIVAIVLFNQFFAEPGKSAESAKPINAKVISANERVKVTSELKDYRRNLKDPDYMVIMNFAFQLDSKKAKEDFDKIIEIEIKPIISRILADLEPDDLLGSTGEDMLESKLLNEINPVLPKGKLVKVEITDYMITPM